MAFLPTEDGVAASQLPFKQHLKLWRTSYKNTDLASTPSVLFFTLHPHRVHPMFHNLTHLFRRVIWFVITILWHVYVNLKHVLSLLPQLVMLFAFTVSFVWWMMNSHHEKAGRLLCLETSTALCFHSWSRPVQNISTPHHSSSFCHCCATPLQPAGQLISS